MYQIVCDDYILHDPRIDDLKVINAQCSLEVNKTGLLTFKIPPTHPYYNKIKRHVSQITLYQENTILFSGRVLNDETDFYKIKTIECEGELSYLLDSIIRSGEYHLDSSSSDNVVRLFLSHLIINHNRQVDEFKRFRLGLVTVKDPNNYLYKISNYENTLEYINDRLLGSYGGYFFIRHSDGARYLDYLADFTNVSNQVINFGENILNMNKLIKGEHIYTALIPLGAKLNENETELENRLKISSLPDETDGTIVKVNDYIYDSEAVKKYGWVWKVIKYDNVTVDTNLLSKAKKDLSSSINEYFTIELTAIDLHLLNVNIDKISVGDKIRCISKPHDIDLIMIVKSMDIDIDYPENTKIKLTLPDQVVYTENSISKGNNDNEKNVVDIKDELDESYPTYEDLNNKLSDYDKTLDDKFTNYNNDLKDWVRDNYSPLTAGGETVNLSEYAKIVDVNNAFNELATALEGV